MSNKTEEEHDAFRLPKILESIFEYCGIEDIKSCRLVSTGWCIASLKCFVSSASVKIDDGVKMINFLEQTDDDVRHRHKKVHIHIQSMRVTNYLIDREFWRKLIPSLDVRVEVSKSCGN